MGRFILTHLISPYGLTGIFVSLAIVLRNPYFLIYAFQAASLTTIVRLLGKWTDYVSEGPHQNIARNHHGNGRVLEGIAVFLCLLFPGNIFFLSPLYMGAWIMRLAGMDALKHGGITVFLCCVFPGLAPLYIAAWIMQLVGMDD
jgi:hypothetical protein